MNQKIIVFFKDKRSDKRYWYSINDNDARFYKFYNSVTNDIAIGYFDRGAISSISFMAFVILDKSIFCGLLGWWVVPFGFIYCIKVDCVRIIFNIDRRVKLSLELTLIKYDEFQTNHWSKLEIYLRGRSVWPKSIGRILSSWFLPVIFKVSFQNDARNWIIDKFDFVFESSNQKLFQTEARKQVFSRKA